MNKYTKKQVTISAIQFIDDSEDEISKMSKFANGDFIVDHSTSEPTLKIDTLEGVMTASLGDYIIKGIKGEFYPCKPDIFEATYNKYSEIMTFGDAIEALKLGKCIARKGWNGNGMFVFKQVPSEIDVENIVPKMQSLPQSAKNIFLEKFENKDILNRTDSNDYTKIKYGSQMAIVKPDNSIDSWVASSSDTFAEDWYIVK